MRWDEHLESATGRPVAGAIYPITPGVEEDIARASSFHLGQRSLIPPVRLRRLPDVKGGLSLIDIHGRRACLER
jgi:hypothetical protein